MEIEIHQGDITTMNVDAIVNAANSSLLGGGGVDGAIHSAGGPRILSECRQLRASTFPDGLPTGEAVATTAGALAATWVIHTVGPVYSAQEDRTRQLENCYANSLRRAKELGVGSIAFPLISAGVYRWPKSDAVNTALQQIYTGGDAMQRCLLVLFDSETYRIALDANAQWRTRNGT